MLPDTSIFSVASIDRGETRIRINMQYLCYNSVTNSISMFIGAGLNFIASPTYQRVVNNENNLEKISTSNSGYGADLIIGVEWFVRSNIGLSAEYSSRYNSFKDETTTTMDDNDGSKKTEIRNNSGSEFSYDRIKFGVSIYF